MGEVPMGITREQEQIRKNSRWNEKFCTCRPAPDAAKNGLRQPGTDAAKFRRGRAIRIAMRVKAFVFALASLSCVAAQAQPPDGRAVFNAQCTPCHQPDAKGVPGQFPPLAGNTDIFLARDFPARVVLFGMTGRIKVKGQAVDGAMPPLGAVLKDEEIAAVVNYVRDGFGNDALAPKGPKTMVPLDAATIAGLRKMKDADQVYAYRKKLKAAAKN
jgi:mono/diheme cytochrome c family protein